MDEARLLNNTDTAILRWHHEFRKQYLQTLRNSSKLAIKPLRQPVYHLPGDSCFPMASEVDLLTAT